jgi:outer membrane receptor protein involved in Fe transport
MNLIGSGFSMGRGKVAALLGTASLLTISSILADRDRAYAGEVMTAAAVPEEIPENVLITGSLIRGTVAVGVPVVNLSPMDFAQTGALTTADLFKNFPAAVIMNGDIGSIAAARIDRGGKVNLRFLDTTNATRGLLMVDGMRVPPSGNGVCAVDPSIIPSVSLDHIDVLVDGASATYGSDAISGVINLILRRNYDGAQTQFRITNRVGGANRYSFSQLWGRTWDGGQITLSYEWYDEMPVHGKDVKDFRLGVNHSPWGYDDRTPLGVSTPGTISKAPFPSGSSQLGTSCGYFNDPLSGLAAKSSSCYAVPLGTGTNVPIGTVGPTAPFSASTLNWSTFSQDPNFAGPLTPSAGTRNQFSPYSTAYYSPFEERNGGAITIDQRLTKDISFYGEGFYSNRRSKFLNSSINNPSASQSISLIGVPTFNPYYPTGGAPTNLQVSYDMSIEVPPIVDGNELIDRYQIGLNIGLPAGWESQIFYSETYDSNSDSVHSDINKSAVSAALGWTIAAKPPAGTGPGFGTWTKPAAIPYLNLFCDPNTFQCNSETTLNYIIGERDNVEKWWINEKGVKADGPLFDLPGGTVKMAIGANYTANAFSYFNADNTSANNLTVNPITDALHQNVWAVFTQVNIPIFSDQNAIFGVRRLELEASWRHDQYDTVGGTSNPKVSFNWSPVDDLTFKGSWGSNFRAPGFGETSFIAKAVINGRNLGTLQAVPSQTVNSCPAVGSPLPELTSGAGKLQVAASNFANAMAAAGVPGYASTPGCVDKLDIPDPTTPYVNSLGQSFSTFADPGITTGLQGLLHPGGVIAGPGGEPMVDPIRQFTGFGRQLKPENATSWSIGFDYTPSTNVLRGLNLQATYYIVKVTGALQNFGGGGFSDTFFNDPTLPFAFPSPQDLVDGSGNRLCPDLPNSKVSSIPIPANLVPYACPEWVQGVTGIMSNPKNTIQSAATTLVYFINDGATFNVGWVKLDGIDWQFSYDWDMGNIGAFNVGAIGTYYLHQYRDTQPGTPLSEITDTFHTTTGSSNAEAEGVTTTPRMVYRARLGWTNGPWNATLFMDYKSHYYNNQGSPPNVNNTCVSPGSGTGGGTFPCFQNGYTNLQPNFISFDLSLGYDTGDDPANDYLKHIGLQVVVQNVLDKHPAYTYTLNPFACACGGAVPAFGRMTSLIITKTW